MPRQRPERSVADHAPAWLLDVGIRGWLIVGAAGVVALGWWFLSATWGIMAPLIVAVVLGALFYPLVNLLHRWHVPRALGAVSVMLLLIFVGALTVGVVVDGVLQQADQIQSQLTAGIDSLQQWLDGTSLPPGLTEQVTKAVQQALPKIASGFASLVGSSLTGTAAFLFGVFLGAFMLFYILSDWATLSAWVGRHLGLPEDVGAGVVEDSAAALQQNFAGITISGFIVALTIGIGLWLLDVPLVIPIALVTFLTSYIPYFGAIISGIFAFLIALGSGGLGAAVAVLVVILVAQNIIQTIAQNKFASERMSLHPLAGLLATILGGTFFGLLGGVLGAPLVAIAVRAQARISAYAKSPAAGEGAAPVAGGAAAPSEP